MHMCTYTMLSYTRDVLSILQLSEDSDPITGRRAMIATQNGREIGRMDLSKMICLYRSILELDTQLNG